jgi:hypothetical protein
MIATLFLAVCGAFVIVVPARGNEESKAAPKELNARRMDMAPSETERSALAPGGCKSVATFTSSAAPELQKDGCVGCHSGANATAKNALDLTSVGTNDTAACSQALAKVNLANRAQSVIIQAPAGAHAHMGGKVDDAAVFTAALLGWINNE